MDDCGCSERLRKLNRTRRLLRYESEATGKLSVLEVLIYTPLGSEGYCLSTTGLAVVEKRAMPSREFDDNK